MVPSLVNWSEPLPNSPTPEMVCVAPLISSLVFGLPCTRETLPPKTKARRRRVSSSVTDDEHDRIQAEVGKRNCAIVDDRRPEDAEASRSSGGYGQRVAVVDRQVVDADVKRAERDRDVEIGIVVDVDIVGVGGVVVGDRANVPIAEDLQLPSPSLLQVAWIAAAATELTQATSTRTEQQAIARRHRRCPPQASIMSQHRKVDTILTADRTAWQENSWLMNCKTPTRAVVTSSETPSPR